MEQLLFFLALLCTAHAQHKDLSQKVFTFPVEGATSYVKLIARPSESITALSLCMRFYSSLDRAQTLFSLAVPSEANGFFLLKPSEGVYRLNVNGTALTIVNLPENENEWNSVCCTWNSRGLTTIWANGKRSDRKILQPTVTLTGTPFIVLGQDQDTYGGGFSAKQSFVGDITDVHLWDRPISLCEVSSYMKDNPFTPGNLLNWKNLQYSINDTVYVENRDFGKLSC